MASKSTKSTKELATLPEFAIQTIDSADLREIMGDNLGGESLGVSDFERLRVPSGGGLAWTVTDEDGEEVPAKVVEGVIVHAHTARTYWAESIETSGGSTPPDCYSNDGKIGIGEIPHDDKASRACATCPLNVFGSSEKGSGKACKETRVLYLLRPGELLPTIVSVPPSSLVNFRRYALRLTSKATSLQAVTTRLSLEKSKNAAGIEFSRVVFERGERLPDELRERVSDYASMIEGLVQQGAADYAETVAAEA